MTVVEWLEDNIHSDTTYNEINVLIKQAIEMEKQQIIDAWLSAWKDSMLNPLEDKYYQPQGEEYYNETYKDETETND